jgi:hypothetical protein
LARNSSIAAPAVGPCVVATLLRGAIQNALQGHSPVQTNRSGVATFGNPRALRFLPMPTLEEAGRLQPRPIDAVETPRVDGDPVRLRARDIKGVHAAMRAEGVLRHAGAKGVDSQRVFALQQFEILGRGRQVKDALHGANRAVALRQQVEIDPRPEAYPATMAAALALLSLCPRPTVRVLALASLRHRRLFGGSFIPYAAVLDRQLSDQTAFVGDGVALAVPQWEVSVALSEVASSSPPAPSASCIYLILFGSGFVGLGRDGGLHCVPTLRGNTQFFPCLGSLHESALSVRHLGRSMNGLRAGMSAPPLMAAARVAAGVTSLTCQQPTCAGN